MNKQKNFLYDTDDKSRIRIRSESQGYRHADSDPFPTKMSMIHNNGEKDAQVDLAAFLSLNSKCTAKTARDKNEYRNDKAESMEEVPTLENIFSAKSLKVVLRFPIKGRTQANSSY